MPKIIFSHLVGAKRSIAAERRGTKRSTFAGQATIARARLSKALIHPWLAKERERPYSVLIQGNGEKRRGNVSVSNLLGSID